ncbi:hypothetical protein N4G70_31935 [Streptomyces sp. ASQP_92]|uniref:hypothetical protein n=1 Tax=Streptomyces sp. ASQP_92 TaxID=2979116 RepID=UPI0021BF37D2|nr:hypothetical protein [Streptomyces sp. ASQP_92]MCT9093445.1 hypothetical protein [Streptomyces sp. ASQP_92]
MPTTLTVPLLDLTALRRGYTAYNITAALKAIGHIVGQGWTPLAPYPGSDTLWLVRCELCDTVGLRFYSHLRRGRPLKRHPGCLPLAEQAAALAALPTTPRAVFRVEEILREALTAAGHDTRVLQAREALVVRLPGGPAEIWINGTGASIGYEPDEHTGWMAVFRPDGDDTCGPDGQLLYRSDSRTFGADTEGLVKAVRGRAATYAAEQAASAEAA